jgi:ferredoxin
MTQRGIAIDKWTFETSVPGVFAGGNSITKSRMAIQASGHGKFLSQSVDQYLRGNPVSGPVQRFNASLGKARVEDFPEFIKEAEDYDRIVVDAGFEDDEAVRESSRCFGCDCRKATTCKLRELADEYHADQRRFPYLERKALRKVVQNDLLVFEPGKCIKCGLCVQIARESGENLGLTFVGRGFEISLETPFGRPITEGLEKAAAECIAACPTAALSWRDRTKE